MGDTQTGSVGAEPSQAARKTLSKSDDLTVLNPSTSWNSRSQFVARGDTHKTKSKSGHLAVLSVGVCPKGDKTICVSDSGSSDTASVENDSDIEPEQRKVSANIKGKPSVLARPLRNSTKKKAIETFAGCGRLAGELKRVGFEAIGIDYKDNKDKTVSKVINMDLSSQCGVKMPSGEK